MNTGRSTKEKGIRNRLGAQLVIIESALDVSIFHFKLTHSLVQ